MPRYSLKAIAGIELEAGDPVVMVKRSWWARLLWKPWIKWRANSTTGY